MNDLPWFPWSNNYREDEWFLSLTDAEKWAWVALLSRANETAWKLPLRVTDVTSVTFGKVQVIATNTHCDLENLLAVLRSGLKCGGITETEDGDLYIKSGEKYRKHKQDSTAAERMRKHRDKQKDSVTDVTRNVTDVTTVTATPQYTTPQHNNNPPVSTGGSSMKLDSRRYGKTKDAAQPLSDVLSQFSGGGTPDETENYTETQQFMADVALEICTSAKQKSIIGMQAKMVLKHGGNKEMLRRMLDECKTGDIPAKLLIFKLCESSDRLMKQKTEIEKSAAALKKEEAPT